MNREVIESYLSFINYDKPAYIVLKDLKVYYSFLRGKMSTSIDVVHFFEIALRNSPYATYIFFEEISRQNEFTECTRKKINELFQEYIFEPEAINISNISDLICLSIIYEKNEDMYWGRLILENDDVIEKLCVRIIQDIQMLDDCGRNTIKALKILYHHVSPILINRLKKDKYEFQVGGNERELFEFIMTLLGDGEFSLASLLLKYFSRRFIDILSIYNIEDIEAQIYEGLHKCRANEFMRGTIIYRKYVLVDDIDNKVLFWRNKILSIKTDIALNELPTTEFLCYCFAIQQDTDAPKSIVKNYQIDLNLVNKANITKEKPIKEYRRAIMALLKAKKIDECAEFMESTSMVNVDRYISNPTALRPTDISNQLGVSLDEKELVDSIVMGIGTVHNKVFIYMNSFLRGMIAYPYFVERMYPIHGKKFLKELKTYPVGGTIKMDHEVTIYSLLPNTIRQHFKDKLFIDSDYLVLMPQIDIENNTWYQTKLALYNPNSNTFTFSIIGTGEAAGIDLHSNSYKKSEIQDLLISTEYTSNKCRIIKRVIIEATIKNNITELLDLSILQLEMIISSLTNMEIAEQIIDCFGGLNYFFQKCLNTMRKGSRFIASEKYKTINRLWQRLLRSGVNIKDLFYIYRNTILRCICSLSEFLDSVPQENVEISDLLSDDNSFVGRISSIARKEEDKTRVIIEVVSEEFNSQNRIASKNSADTCLDRFILEISLPEQESIDQFLKNNDLFHSRSTVLFEIKQYCGKCLFNIHFIRTIRKNYIIN